MIAFDTLRAAETRTDAGINATHVKSIVAASSEAVGEPITRADLERFATKADLDPLATKADLERFATKADLAALQAAISELKAASTWRIVPASGAFAAIVKLAP